MKKINKIVSSVIPMRTYKNIEALVKKGYFKNRSSAVCELLNTAVIRWTE